MMGRTARDRGLSPAVGIALLTAIAVFLAVIAAGMAFALAEEREPAPGVSMSLEAADSGALHRLVHESGEELDGDRVAVRGVGNADTLAGRELAAGEHDLVAPTDETVTLVWFGEGDASYTIWETTVSEEDTVPDPDEGCAWVENESNGGVDDVKVVGMVVNCDIETEKVIEVADGGIVIGDTTSERKEVDADDAHFYGDVAVERNLNLQDGIVTGGITSGDLVKVDTGTVGGTIDAADTVELVDGSSLGGDVASQSGLVKVLDSHVSGSIVTQGSVKLQNATVGGEVYVEASDFDCTDSTIAGQDCGQYTPKDPDAY